MLSVGLGVGCKVFGFVRAGGGDVGGNGGGFLHFAGCEEGLFMGVEDDDALAFGSGTSGTS